MIFIETNQKKLQQLLMKIIQNECIFNQQLQGNHLTNTRTKLSFLEQEKQRLDMAFQDLEQNNKLLRSINTELMDYEKVPSDHFISLLSHQNASLEKSYRRILRENENLSAQRLLMQQIMDQNTLENRTIIKGYEAKIQELRRKGHSKQSKMQELEQKLIGVEEVIVPANNITLLFYNEVDQLKRIIERLTINNKQLSNENEDLKHHKEGLQKKLQLMEALTLRSKLMFGEFKQLYAEQKRSHSVPRKDTDLPFTGCLHSSKCRLNEGQTRESSECQPNKVGGSAKMLLYREVLEVQKLSRTCEQLKHQVEAERQSKARLVASYVQQAKRTGELSKELNYYQQSTRDLLMMLSHRRQTVGRSQEKSRGDRLLRSLKLPARTPVNSERKKYWLSVQASMKPDKRKLLQIKKKYKKTLRSLSCSTDYRTLVESQEQLVLKKHITSTGQKPKLFDEELDENPQDFSLMMETSLDAQISIIASATPNLKMKISKERFDSKETPEIDNFLDESIL